MLLRNKQYFTINIYINLQDYHFLWLVIRKDQLIFKFNCKFVSYS